MSTIPPIIDAETSHGGSVRPARRDELIDAAISAISAYGLSKTTVSRVARLAGLSAGIVNFYFRSKDALLLATLRRLVEEFETSLASALQRSRGAKEALEAIVDMRFSPALSDPRKVAVWSAFWGETQAREDYLALCGDTDQRYFEVLLQLCRELIEGGGYEHLDAEAVALGFEGVMESLLQTRLADPSGFDREHAVRTSRAYLASLFPEHFALTEPKETAPVTALDPRSARLLPPWTYFDDEFLELEKTRLFRRHWQLVCHTCDVPAAGDYETLDLADERALVLRGDDGQIRAFHNVCRHRGSRVVARAHGNCPRAIICPFHGWSYDLRGNLKGIPAASTFRGLDRSALGLIPIDCEVWHGFVFVRFGREGPSVAEMMAPLETELAPYRLGEMLPLDGGDEEVPVNWKSLHDIDNEGYHVAVGHPALNTLLVDYEDELLPHNVTVSRARIEERRSRHWSVEKYQKLLPRFAHLPEKAQRAWLYWGMFPNLSLAAYPDMMEYYQTIPLGVERTLLRGRRYALPDARREASAARYLNQRINQRVGAEDLQLVQWSYEAMRSSVFPRNRLSEIEAGVARFHDAIRQEIPIAAMETVPPHGTLAARNRALLESASPTRD